MSLGLRRITLNNIFITHADGYHIGSHSELKDQIEAIVYSSNIKKIAFEKGESSRSLKVNGFSKLNNSPLSALFISKLIKVDEILVQGQIFSKFDKIKVVDSKGHTPGHLSFYLEN